MTASVAVVGAGISGLAAAWAVRRAGLPVVVLEASDRVGGAISTQEIAGFRIERGPSSMMESPALGALLDEVGLAEARVGPVRGASRRYLVRHGRPVAAPHGPPSVLTTPLVSLTGKLRALAEPLVPAARPWAPEETLAALVRRRFGAEVLAALIDPIVSGVYAGDPERLSARHALRVLHDLEQREGSVLAGMARGARRKGVRRPAMLSLERGLGQLPDTIAASLGSAVQRRTRLVELGRHDGAWTLVAERDGRSAYHRVDAVVLATPAHALASIDTEPGLGALLATIARVPHAPLATVTLGFRRADVAHPLDGFGMLVPSREGLDVLGTLFASSVFAGRAPAGHVLLTCFVGGARRPALVAEPADVLERRALDALRPLLGIRGAPTLTHVARWTPGIPQYEVGHGEVLAAAARAEAHVRGLALAGSWRGGVSLGDCVASGLAAGERAASFAREGTAAVGTSFPSVG